jgi:hypothetical protein
VRMSRTASNEPSSTASKSKLNAAVSMRRMVAG